MVMASAGVNNMPGGGDGNPSAASPAGSQEWHLTRRRRLSPLPFAAAGSSSGGGGCGDPDAAAGPSRWYCRPRRSSSPPPSSSSDSEDELGGAYSEYEEDTEEEEEGVPRRMLSLPAVLGLPVPAGLWMGPPPLPPPQQQPAWPLAFGSLAIAGRMRDMEDTVSVHPNFYTWVDGTPMHFFAVFDGHGGTHVSHLCRDRMHELLAEDLALEAARFLQRRHQHQAGDEEEASWRAALVRTFGRADSLAAHACACGRATLPRCSCRLSGVTSAIVGSTAVVALLAGARIVVANCGDSRAVLCRGDRRGAPPVPLSTDHKPDRPDERARIESVGGQVIYVNGPRVRGILAMSRALGDRFLRPEVISEPEITITQRTGDDQCLILASDGMWDAIDNQTACDVARHTLEDGSPAAAANAAGGGVVNLHPDRRCMLTATLLARLALSRGSMDNISIIVIDLKNRAD